MNRTAIVAIGLSMMLFGCGKVENDLVLEPETIAVVEQLEVLDEELEEVGSDVEVEELVEEIAEETSAKDAGDIIANEQVQEFENIKKMFTIGKADIFNKADETSERLATVDENYEVSVVGSEGEYSEVRWLEGTAFVKTVLLSAEKVEDFANWEEKTEDSTEEAVEKEEVPAEVIEAAESTNEVTVVEEVAPSQVSNSNSAEQKRQENIAKLLAAGAIAGSDMDFSEGHDYGTYGEVTKDIVLH